MSEKSKKQLNARTLLFGIGTIIVVLSMLITDPDAKLIQNLPFGSSTVTFFVYLGTTVLGVGILYLCEKALFFYVNYYELYKSARSTPQSSAQMAMAISLQLIAVAIVIHAFVG